MSEPTSPTEPPRIGTALRARGVGVAIDGTSILSNVDLDLEPGEVLAVVGPNGAGGTTGRRRTAHR